MNYVTNPMRDACAVLLALAIPAGTAWAAPPGLAQYPSAANLVQPSMQSALDKVRAEKFDATWLEQKAVSDDGQAGDLFGFRVLVWGDTAFISAPAPLYRSGKVYVMKNVAGVWTETQQLAATPSIAPPPNWSDFFGWSLSLSGDTLLVGAPEVFNPMFGPVGGAYVFVRSGDTWVQQQELLGPDSGNFDWVGSAVALAGDTAFVGAPNHDANKGTVYVFTRSGTAWSEGTALVASDGASGDARQFGGAIKCDGNTLIIGAPGPDYSSTGIYAPGEAYAFENSGGVWTEAQILRPDDGADGDQFGYSLAISGAELLIGAPAANIGANSHQGAAYLFDGTSGTWSQTTKLTIDGGVAYDQFGQSVALQDSTVLVGMWSHNDDFNSPPAPRKPGSAYLFSGSQGNWSLSNQFTASDATDGDSFGWDVAMDGATLAVSSQGPVDGNEFQGATYFYVPDNTIFADGFDGAH